MKLRTFILLLPLLLVCCKKENTTPVPSIKEGVIDTIIHANLKRTFLVRVPQTVNRTRPVPLVIVFHGTTSNGIIMEGATHFTEIAEREGFIVAYPDGYEYPWDKPTTTWNVGGPWEEWTGGNDDVGFISKLIDLISANYIINPMRIYLVGGSNGSRMSFRIADQLQHRIAAIGCFAGPLTYKRQYTFAYKVPVVYFHCKDDPYVPTYQHYINGTYYIETVENILSVWAADSGCEYTPISVYKTDNVELLHWKSKTSPMEIKWYYMEKGQHWWPEIETCGINGSDTIWQFFQKHSKIL